MRLNAGVAESLTREPSTAQNALIDLLSEVMRAPAIVTGAEPGARPSDSIVDFYKRYYVKYDTSGTLPKSIGPISAKLSTGEAELLQFLLDGDLRHEKVYILCDHAGKGKSTLAQYICSYLIPTEPSLRRLILPVYFSIFDHADTIRKLNSREEVDLYLDEQVQSIAFNVAHKHFHADVRRILQDANSHDPSLQGVFPASVIATASKDPDTWFAEQSQFVRRRLMFAALMHYSKHVRPVVIVLDDADRLELDTQRFALGYLYRRLGYGALGVLAMRRSTYLAMRADILDKEYKVSQPLRWTAEGVKQVLVQRLAAAKKTITLRWGMRTDASASEIVTAFVDLLRRPESIEMLTTLSNQNMHSLFGKLAIIARSQYFRDEHVTRELLLRETVTGARGEPATGAPFWIVLSLLLGNYAGTFKTSDEDARFGVLNVFCTRELNHRPFTQFVRLHILTRLYDLCQESDALPVETLRKEYIEIFRNDAHFSYVFDRALRRLFSGALILTRSCKRYLEEQSFGTEIRSDSIFIAPAGRYYVSKMIGFVEYLWFTKDDIDWLERPLFERATIDSLPRQKALGTGMALTSLMRLEYQLLDDLRADSVPSMERLTRYAASFSARQLPGSKTALFTELMAARYYDHLRRKFSNYESLFGKALAEMEAVREEYSRVRAALAEPPPDYRV